MKHEKKILTDAINAGIHDDSLLLHQGGTKAKAYADAIATYLACLVSKCADKWSAVTAWDKSRDTVSHVFTRHAISMVWDFAEANPLSESTGNFLGAIDWVTKVIEISPCGAKGVVKQADATTSNLLNYAKSIVVCTDPPYYDNIGYADLSDFFYVWLRRSLTSIYPNLFQTIAVPKEQELVANPYRFGGDKEKAKKFFEDGLNQVFTRMREGANPDYPFSVFYAFKQSETEQDKKDKVNAVVASTGWETMLEGLIKAGFSITGTLPMRTELANRTRGHNSNALATSVVLVCRPRPENAPSTTRRQFVNTLKRELPDALQKLQQGNIAPVDLAQASIGPGMAIYSRYSNILESDGTRMSVRTALQLINLTLDDYLAEQEGEFDAGTRFALIWFEQYAFNEGLFGDAETLSKAKNTSVQGLVDAGVLVAKAGKVRLLRRNELLQDWNPKTDKRLTVWEATQYMIRELQDGAGETSAARLLSQLGTIGEAARELAYRLYNICDRKGWASEGVAYNSLVISWSEISRLAADSHEDWSTLDKFQRTRGVLRLMAKVIHSLWEAQDKSLLIMPASISIDDGRVREELTRYLEDNWVPVIEKDVDGVNSLPLACDRNNPNLGRYSACRRVARTIYLGSAPTFRATNRGLEDLRIKLGCVQPGERASTFGDALRRLTDQATHLYIDNTRYWFSTQPSVTRLAQERGEQIQQDTDKVWEEIIRRLRTDKQRGEFASVHIAPSSTSDIPDEASVRLVVLRPEYSHKAKQNDTKALSQAEEILNSKGTSPRYCRNMLLFLAPDQTKLELLERNICQYLAWNSILQEKESLNLDVFQSNQATTKQQQTDKDVKNLIQEAYIWLLVPEQPDPYGAVEWLDIRLQKHDSPILQASRKAIHEEHLITNYSAVRLRLEALDTYLWSNVNHLDIKKLWEYLANYLYLPRLKNEKVLLQAVQEGIANLLLDENFAYATGWDEAKGRYLGLKTAEHINVTLSTASLIIKPEVAQRQLAADIEAAARAKILPFQAAEKTGEYEIQNPGNTKNTNSIDDTRKPKGGTVQPTKITPPKRFYGTVKVDPLRLQRDVGQIADEVVQHFTSLVGSEVEISLELHVNVPDGIPENLIRTVMENCKVLKFESQGFEQE